MAAKLRKGDKVVVLAGKDKGKEGTISSVDPKSNKAVVDGINMAIRHTRQSQTSQGGRLPKAMPIELSNLKMAMQSTQRALRLWSVASCSRNRVLSKRPLPKHTGFVKSRGRK